MTNQPSFEIQMAESRKVLVAFDPVNPGRKSSDFLVPIVTDDGELALLGSRSGKIAPYGLVVMTNKTVNENDLFAKLVDTGRTIASVDECLARLAKFIDQLNIVRIGNIVEISSNNRELKLEVAANTPSGFSRS